MRKERVVARDVSKLASHQAETVVVQRIVVSILTRGLVGRLKWLLFGR